MASRVAVRRARAEDEPARAALLRAATHEHFAAAFSMFFFQELTLQCGVLAGAVLFIFCGASAGACGALVPAAAALVALGVRAAHAGAAARHAAGLRAELAGWVAEAEGARVVGTVSLSEWHGGARGRLHALAVARGWRRRGAARALCGAAAGAAAAAGLLSVEAVTSGVQTAGRAALHAAGWPLRATYHRPLLGAALTLPMAHLGRDLPAP